MGPRKSSTAQRHRELLDRLDTAGVLEALVTADEPTAIGAGVVRLARLAAGEGRGRPVPA